VRRGSNAKKGATTVDLGYHMFERKLLYRKVIKLVRIFTTQKKLHGLVEDTNF
jgi:hypothetical protein